MTSRGDHKGQQTLAALAELVRDSIQPPTPTQLDRGLASLRARIDAERPEESPALPRRARFRRSVRWSLVGTLASATVLAALAVVRSGHLGVAAAPSSLSYEIEGGSLVDGGYLRESGRAGIKLTFAEGTEFVLMPGTRSRLRAVDAAGARIAIEHGTASFQVTPSHDHRWQIDVGPFLVTVKGTVFSVSWDAEAERFELKLRHGHVTVSGPVTGGEIALSAGQRLLVDLPQGETTISEAKPEAWRDSAEPREQPPMAADGATRPPEKRAPVSDLRGTPSGKLDRLWARELAAGHLDRILAEAERAGLSATLERASGEDLLALADAARYRRRMDLARQALLAERRRFPGSPRALDAAFLLGSVEEASDHGLARAIEWYEEYLNRVPAGTYASEALGRKMTLTSKLQGASQARPIAEEYLRRFPNGTYAGPARAFLRAP
jgi:ferric-dicitrate binding protein FerR (iron transport regulator)